MCLVLTSWDWMTYWGICPSRKQILLLSATVDETLFSLISVDTAMDRVGLVDTAILLRFHGHSNLVMSK